jgi:GLPGLI family protein
MKVKLYISLFLVFPVLLFAQENQLAIASVSYEFIHVNDTNNRNEPRKEEMIVYLGQQGSVYKSLTLAKRMEEIQLRMKEMGVSHPSGAKSSIRIASPNISSSALLLLPREKRLVILDKIGDTDYVIDSNFPEIDWEIGEESKDIAGYRCQQATGSFGGRDYTVWFAPDLPFSFGPWKLHGLPGLILQAEDSKKEVIFNFLNFDKVDDVEVTVSIPSNSVRTNANDFAKAKEAFQKNPMMGMGGPTTAGGNTNRVIIMKDASGREISRDEMQANMERSRKENEAKNNNPLVILRNEESRF